MDLILKEIVHLILDCENTKQPLREAERIRRERKCYENIKSVVEPFMDEVADDEKNILRSVLADSTDKTEKAVSGCVL